jgi:hypothetical protein
MVHADEELDTRTQPSVDEGWEVDFDQADETPARRRLSDHERWVLSHLIHEAPAR